jgi:hypothetical protein
MIHHTMSGMPTPAAGRSPEVVDYTVDLLREFIKPTRAEIARLRIRTFLAAWDLVADERLPTTLTTLTLDGTVFDVTVDDLRAVVGDMYGPPE